ncbi:MAG: preprotein translocase subunit SecG [Acidobacteriota bacterium]
MATLLLILHIMVSLFLVFVVLLQSGQAADLAGAFGGGGSQTALGMRGAATLLQKLTTTSAVIFMLTSLSLGIVGRHQSSVIEGLEQEAPVSAPANPAEPAPPTPQGQQQETDRQGSGQQPDSDQSAGQRQGSGRQQPG